MRKMEHLPNRDCEAGYGPVGDARSFGVKTDKMRQNWLKTDKSKPCESI